LVETLRFEKDGPSTSPKAMVFVPAFVSYV